MAAPVAAPAPFAQVTIDEKKRPVYIGPIRASGNFHEESNGFCVTCDGARISVVTFIGKHTKFYRKAGAPFFPRRNELKDLCEIFENTVHKKELERRLYEDADKPLNGIPETGYAIWNHTDKKVIGRIGIERCAAENCVSLDITLHPAYRKQKYAPEALYLMLSIVSILGREKRHAWKRIFFHKCRTVDPDSLSSINKLLCLFKTRLPKKFPRVINYFCCDRINKRFEELHTLHLKASTQIQENGAPAPLPEEDQYGERMCEATALQTHKRFAPVDPATQPYLRPDWTKNSISTYGHLDISDSEEDTDA